MQLHFQVFIQLKWKLCSNKNLYENVYSGFIATCWKLRKCSSTSKCINILSMSIQGSATQKPHGRQHFLWVKESTYKSLLTVWFRTTDSGGSHQGLLVGVGGWWNYPKGHKINIWAMALFYTLTAVLLTQLCSYVKIIVMYTKKGEFVLCTFQLGLIKQKRKKRIVA